MRGLFNVTREKDLLGNSEPLPAIRPKQIAPVMRLADDGARELASMSWGFRTPKKSKRDPTKFLKPAAWNNARDDKMGSGLWKSSFEARRCLVPASSFAEAKGRSPATWFWFGLADGDPDARPPFAFAGLWRDEAEHMVEDTKGFPVYTVITTGANDLVRPVHPERMPVILDPADFDAWLNGSPEDAAQLLRSYPSEKMRIVRQGEGITADPA